MRRVKAKVIILWVGVLYFGAVFWSNMGDAFFGTLGVIRPSETTNGMIEASRANDLIQHFAAKQQRMTSLVGIGAVVLVCVAVWFTADLLKRVDRVNES